MCALIQNKQSMVGLVYKIRDITREGRHWIAAWQYALADYDIASCIRPFSIAKSWILSESKLRKSLCYQYVHLIFYFLLPLALL